MTTVVDAALGRTSAGRPALTSAEVHDATLAEVHDSTSAEVPRSRSSPPSRPHVVVLGAGVCGLYAARVLAAKGFAVTVLERDEVVGGLAAGRERRGNYYDFGVHHLHAFDTREPLKEIRNARAIFEVLEERAHKNARPLEDVRPTDLAGKALDFGAL